MDPKNLNIDKDPLKIFIPIIKIDEEKRLVFGRVTEEKADSSNETFDYSTSKPYYEEWSGYFQKATDGKSYGNLRAMHDPKKASGVIQNLNLDDREKAVEVVAKVVDEDDWKKCVDGVYTGFSQGGRYVKKWFDGKTNRYTAAPNEISLVDYPALKSATFSLVKSNGIVEEHAFKEPPAANKPEEKKVEKKGEAFDPSKWDLKKWAGEEITDTINAAYCLQTIGYLYEKELGEGEKDQVAALKTVIENLKAFISSEIQEKYEAELMVMSEKLKDLQKSGARHSKTDRDVMEKIHNHTGDMGAECKCNKCNETKKLDPESDLAKSMTKALLAKVQAIHDHTNELGVECKCAKCQKSDGKEEDEMDMKKLEEITKRQDALEAENKTLKADNDALKKRIDVLEKMPEPAKGVKLDTAAITKQDDSKIDLKKGDEKPDEIKDPVAMMKKVHSEPQIYSLHKPL